MSLELWFAFTITTFISIVTPGPSMLLALYHGSRYGAKRALATALGTVLASLLLGTVAAAGLDVVLKTSELAIHAIKWLGAAYLVYLGVSSWQNASRASHANPATHPASAGSVFVMFRQAFLVSLGNPALILFFAAFFPQFLDLNTALVPQYLLMLGTLALLVFSGAMLYAGGGAQIGPWLQNLHVKRGVDRVTGSVLVGFGLRLVISGL